MSLSHLTITVQDHLALLTINRPKALNALNQEVLSELIRFFSDTGRISSEIKAVMITGAGDKAFVAGADIAAMQRMTALEADAFCQLGHDCMRLIETCPVPVVAAVNGYALGGGFELALACDFIYAAKTARFALPEVNLGLFPGFGGTQRLSRLVGKNRAKELVYTADMISAEEAFSLGVVNKVFESAELLVQIEKQLRKILAKGLCAVSLAKKVINEGADLPLASGLALEQAQFPLVFATEDRIEGIGAFLEKREPRFRGK